MEMLLIYILKLGASIVCVCVPYGFFFLLFCLLLFSMWRWRLRVGALKPCQTVISMVCVCSLKFTLADIMWQNIAFVPGLMYNKKLDEYGI